MARLRDIIQRSTRTLQPAATAVDIGTLYYVTDEGILERSDGTNWLSYASGLVSIGITVDGGGSAITTGLKGFKSVQIDGTIVRSRLLADQSGNVVFDVWKDTFANFPPTVADTITASAKPTLSSTDKSEDTTLTGWTTSIVKGDVLGFNVDSAATITRVTLELEIVVN